MNEPIIPDDLITAKEAAKLLTVTAHTIRAWARAGKLPAFHAGTRLRISKADVLAMLRRVEVAGKPMLPTKAEATAKAMRVDKILREAGIRR